MMWLKKIEETKCPWCGNILSDECCEKTCSNRIISVSYTHLTLPTIA